jgi:hypothetical protein
MMTRLFMHRSLLPLLAVCLWIACKQTTEPKTRSGDVRGTVRSGSPGDASVIRSAFIFLEDSLLATSDSAGAYTVSSLPEGTHRLTCSTGGHRDTTAQVLVEGGKTAVLDFYLTPDFSVGRVAGEFQDQALFNDSLKTNPSLAGWDAKTVYDAATGATLQTKTLQVEVPERRVMLGDSLLATADWWGQYWFKIRTGTYAITGSCEGYESVTQIITVEPNGRLYVNFFMPR